MAPSSVQSVSGTIREGCGEVRRQHLERRCHAHRYITAALEGGDRVDLRDFGVFAVKTRGARTGRNPRNGVEVAVSEKTAPTFKTSRDMHRRLNPTEG